MNDCRVAWSPRSTPLTEIGVIISGGYFLNAPEPMSERFAKDFASRLNNETAGSLGTYHVIYPE